MRAREFLSEKGWNKKDIIKAPGRLEQFLNLIKNKHTFQTKYGPVQIDPSEVDRIEGLLTGKITTNTISRFKTLQGIPVVLGDLEKDAGTVGGGGKSGDTKLKLQPAQVLGHGKPEKGQDITPELAIDMGAFPAKELASRIQNNDYLDTQGPAGLAVKEISKQLSQKQVPIFPKQVPKKQITNVINDAYEYLGVQALIDGVIDFPNMKEFYNHVGGNIQDLLLFFPGSTNNPLADSYALQNRQTDNQIYLSSKGGKTGTGAPSSINKIKIPDNMLSQYKNDESLEFLNFIQKVTPWKQPFEAAKFIKERSKNPNSLGELLPYVDLFDDRFYNWADKTRKENEIPASLKEIPTEYQDLFNLVQKSAAGSKKSLFWNVRNVVKDKFVGPAINSGKPLPQFNARMLEILGHNFVLITSKLAGDKIITKATWPHKMGGTITFEAKDTADKWDSAMTWKFTGV